MHGEARTLCTSAGLGTDHTAYATTTSTFHLYMALQLEPISRDPAFSSKALARPSHPRKVGSIMDAHASPCTVMPHCASDAKVSRGYMNTWPWRRLPKQFSSQGQLLRCKITSPEKPSLSPCRLEFSYLDAVLHQLLSRDRPSRLCEHRPDCIPTPTKVC